MSRKAEPVKAGESLADLATEAAERSGQEAASEAASAADAPEPEPEIRQPDAMTEQVMAGLVTVAGRILCARAEVDPLAPDEVAALARAGAQVAAQYDMAALSPRAAAWLALGMTAAGVAGPRLIVLAERQRKTLDAAPLPPEPPIVGAAAAPMATGEGTRDPSPPRGDGQPSYSGA